MSSQSSLHATRLRLPRKFYFSVGTIKGMRSFNLQGPCFLLLLVKNPLDLIYDVAI